MRGAYSGTVLNRLYQTQYSCIENININFVPVVVGGVSTEEVSSNRVVDSYIKKVLCIVIFIS